MFGDGLHPLTVSMVGTWRWPAMLCSFGLAGGPDKQKGGGEVVYIVLSVTN